MNHLNKTIVATMDSNNTIGMLQEQSLREWETMRKEMEILNSFLRKKHQVLNSGTTTDESHNEQIKEMKATLEKLETIQKTEIELLRAEIEKIRIQTKQSPEINHEHTNDSTTTGSLSNNKMKRGIKSFLVSSFNIKRLARRRPGLTMKSIKEEELIPEISSPQNLSTEATALSPQNVLGNLSEVILPPMTLTQLELNTTSSNHNTSSDKDDMLTKAVGTAHVGDKAAIKSDVKSPEIQSNEAYLDMVIDTKSDVEDKWSQSTITMPKNEAVDEQRDQPEPNSTTSTTPLEEAVSVTRQSLSKLFPIRRKPLSFQKTVSMNDELLMKRYYLAGNDSDMYSIAETYSVISQQSIPIICQNGSVEISCGNNEEGDDDELLEPRVSFASELSDKKQVV
jgi:hypothetical protein